MQQNAFTKVDTWHAAGHTGKPIEDCYIWNTEHKGSDHGDSVDIRIKQTFPDAPIKRAGLTLSTAGGVTATAEYNGVERDVEEFIVTEKIKVITRSVGGGNAVDTLESHYWNALKKKYNLIFFNAAGNDASDGCGGSLPPDVAFYIAACTLNRYGKPVRAFYSSIGPEVDFITFVGFQNGTSFAGPSLAVQAFALCARYGRDVTEAEAFAWLKLHSMDLEAAGFDYNTGWGIPIFPDPTKKYITLKTGEKAFKCDGKKTEIDVAVTNLNGSVFVPTRVIAEALGKKVSATYNEQKKMVCTITDGTLTLLFTEGDQFVRCVDASGNSKKLDAKGVPYLQPVDAKYSRFMIPIRAVSEYFGCRVEWLQADQKVMIMEA